MSILDSPGSHTSRRNLHIGAEIVPSGGVHFRVWSPNCHQVEAVFPEGETGERPLELEAEADGYFAGTSETATAGTRYWFRLDGSERCYPDPASRFQPDGPDGPSQVIDPDAFAWTDHDWPGVKLAGQVIYEMHVGTFTQEGAWAAAAEQLEELADVGITLIEIMPVCDFPGRFGWGYDGVNFFAPTRLYGTPDDFRRFVDRAHAHGIGVILDVVYNHFGPDGNYLPNFSPDYASTIHHTDWGPGINFDGENSGPVREYVLANAGYWIDEFHLDGLRLDATQDIKDDSPEHILAAISRRVREVARGRGTFIVGENEPQHIKLIRPHEHGGYGLDALWNDDFHHTAMVALSGHNEAYYTDYLGSPQEFISAAKYGFLYQGQWYKWQGKRRGTPTRGVPPAAFVTFIQNHDQIANSGRGLRAHALTNFSTYKAMTALMLLGPGTPMLFQGQEFAASTPFFYFADHREDLAKMVKEGRREFMAQFRSIADPEIQATLPDPADPMTFARCKLDFEQRHKHKELYNLHRDLLRLRREEPAFCGQRCGVDGAVLGDDAFVLRFFSEDEDDRLLVINFGIDLHLNPAPEPLLGPPEGKAWEILWTSEDPRYGGLGTPPPDTNENWQIPGRTAVVLRPVEPEAGTSNEEPRRGTP